MATFISISGPSVTGKTSLIDSLCSYRDMNKFSFSPDFKDVVWHELTDSGIFSDFTDITSDPSYMCTYLHRLVDTYNKYIESHMKDEGVFILDECWLDYFIYALLSMWYSRVISGAQEEVFTKIMKYQDKISRYYMTTAKDSQYPPDKFRIRGRITTFKLNRPLEIALYKTHASMHNTLVLPNSEISGDSMFIIDDLRNLGYL